MAKILSKLLSKKEPIKIGHLTSITGDYAYFGQWESEGVDLAVEIANKKGGINGQKIIVVRDDDHFDPLLSKAMLERMIDAQNPQVVIGSPSSDVLLAAVPVVDKNKIVMITALAGSTKISTASSYLFRIYPQTAQEGELLVKFARQSGYDNAAIIYINNQYGLELAKSVKRKAAEVGVEILIVEGYRKDAIEFKDQLARIKEKTPEVIFLLGYPRDMEVILKQAKELEIKTKYFAPDTFCDPNLLLGDRQEMEGVVYVMPQVAFLPEFVKIFKKKYKKEPNIFHGLCYDAANLAILAVERGGNNGMAIRDELFKVKDFPGVTGMITFDQNGDAINRPLEIKTVKEGKSVPLTKS